MLSILHHWSGHFANISSDAFGNMMVTCRMIWYLRRKNWWISLAGVGNCGEFICSNDCNNKSFSISWWTNSSSISRCRKNCRYYFKNWSLAKIKNGLREVPTMVKNCELQRKLFFSSITHTSTFFSIHKI